VEQLALYCKTHNELESLFIEKLVPWLTMKSAAPNSGHEAIADFLGCRVIHAGVTTNYDILVEAAAAQLGEADFQPIVSQKDLSRSTDHSPYLKVHGCMGSGHTRLETVWCKLQLAEEPLVTRMALFRIWLQSTLLDRDVLIVGFWSDWAYLSDILASTVNAIRPRTIYLVDPSPAAVLASKAPEMWSWANAPGVSFHHEQESGAEFLDELRRRVSRAFLMRAFLDADGAYRSLFASAPLGKAAASLGSTSPELYALRRDITGTPPTRIVRQKDPSPGLRVHVAIHQRLIDLDAQYSSHTYDFRGKVLRLIAAPGRLLSEIRKEYSAEPSPLRTVDRVVCVGAAADPTPGSIVRPVGKPSILGGGIGGDWCTDEELRRELN